MKCFITVIITCATLSAMSLKADLSHQKHNSPQFKTSSSYAANSVAWYGTNKYTNVTYNAFFATDGTILTYTSQVVFVKYDVTNQVGGSATIERKFEYPSGLTVADKFQNVILDKVVALGDISYSPMNFGGKLQAIAA